MFDTNVYLVLLGDGFNKNFGAVKCCLVVSFFKLKFFCSHEQPFYCFTEIMLLLHVNLSIFRQSHMTLAIRNVASKDQVLS